MSLVGISKYTGKPDQFKCELIFQWGCKLFVYEYDCQERRILTVALVISGPVPSELPASGMLRRGTAVLVPKLAKVFSIVIRERILVTRYSNPQVHHFRLNTEWAEVKFVPCPTKGKAP